MPNVEYESTTNASCEGQHEEVVAVTLS